MLGHQEAERETQMLLDQRLSEAGRRPLDVPNLRKMSRLRLEEVSPEQGLHLTVCDVLRDVNAGHLLHYLLQDEKVKALA